MTRPNLNAVALVTPKFNGAVGSTGFHVLRTKYADPKFLFYLVQTRDFIGSMSLVVQGALYPAVRPKDIESFAFALPSINEQHRIVAKIEELFSELDKGIESLKTAREQLKVYRQALLKHAFEGKLTEAWRAANPDKLEPTTVLLARIQTEREQRYRQQLQQWEANGKQGSKPKAPKPLPPLSAEELEELPELPEGWGWEKLGNIADLIGGVTKGKNLEGKETVFLPYLRVANVQDGYLDLAEIKHIEVEEGDKNKYRLEIGDVLYTEGGDKDKLGRGAVWHGQIESCIHQNHIFRARVFGGLIRPNILSLYSQTKSAKRYFFRHAKQTTNLASINLTVLANLPIAIFCQIEQEQILQEIEARLSEADQLDQTLTASLQQAEALRQSILKKAFSGQLVAQDASDEPAAALLARIKAERATVVETVTVRQRGKRG
jgi:type I restriction enzyme S subunit